MPGADRDNEKKSRWRGVRLTVNDTTFFETGFCRVRAEIKIEAADVQSGDHINLTISTIPQTYLARF